MHLPAAARRGRVLSVLTVNLKYEKAFSGCGDKRDGRVGREKDHTGKRAGLKNHGGGVS